MIVDYTHLTLGLANGKVTGLPANFPITDCQDIAIDVYDEHEQDFEGYGEITDLLTVLWNAKEDPERNELWGSQPKRFRIAKIEDDCYPNYNEEYEFLI
jgi:hypothetical protein